jgi:hypothetical protein
MEPSARKRTVLRSLPHTDTLWVESDLLSMTQSVTLSSHAMTAGSEAQAAIAKEMVNDIAKFFISKINLLCPLLASAVPVA